MSRDTSYELLHYIDTDPDRDDLIPVVLIHGDFSNGRTTWAHQLSVPGQRMIAVDRRGNGQSPAGPGPFSVASDAEDIVVLLDALGVSQCHLVGHSYGALIALHIAARPGARWRAHPLGGADGSRSATRITSLHLIEPPYLSLLPEDELVRDLAERTRAAVRRGVQKTPSAAAQTFFTALLGEEATAAIMRGPAWPSIVREAPRFVLQQFAGDYDARCLQLLIQRNVSRDMPVVLYTGERSHPALIRLTRFAAGAIPGAHLATIADAGHFVQRKSAFNQALLHCISPGENRC